MEPMSKGVSSGLNEQRFLAIRSLLIELAASLDRTERHAGQAAGGDSAVGCDDPRWRLLLEAVERIAEGPGRAEALQLLFSDPYHPDWRKDGGPRLAGSAGCCGR